jgi:NAD-dependent DNA ligase
MSPAAAAKRHAELVEELQRHDHAYYVLAQPVLSDQEYDRLYRELRDIEAKYPELITPESPSQRVGGKPLDEFESVQHLVPMMSLDNTYSQEEVRAYAQRLQKLLPNEKLEWTLEPKVDMRKGGLSSGLPVAMVSTAIILPKICGRFAAFRNGCVPPQVPRSWKCAARST